MCESWKLSDSLLTVCCRCGFVSVDSLLSRGRWEQVRCRPNPGTPIKINLVLSLVLSRLSGGLGMSLYSPTVYNPPPQLSSPCNLTWIVWLWDVLKINNKNVARTWYFHKHRRKIVLIETTKPHILLTCITTLYKVGTHFFLLCKSCLHVFNVLKIHGRKFFWIHSKKMSKH